MKVVKVFLITLFAFLLSGCYTQLQYSQKMKKITDKEEEKAYAWIDEKEQEAVEDSTNQDVANIPLYYKDYEYEEKYKDCACNPHNVYNFYGNDWFGYDPYDPYYSVKSYLAFRYSYFSPWHHSRHWYHYDPRFSFSFTFGWGSPYYHHFYDPFYNPFFDFYWYGSRDPWYAYRYNNYYRYGNFRYFYDRDRADRNIRYGPRSVGTNRVVTSGNRSRDVNTSTRSGVRTESNVRSRSSVGTTRTRSTTDRNTGSTLRTRSRNSSDNSGGSARTRSRDDNQSRSDLRYPVYIDRTDEPQRPVIINENRLRSRTINLNNISRNREVVSEGYLRNRLQPLQSNRPSIESRSTFLKRMRNFFEDNTSRIINSDRLGSNNHTVRSRSRSSASSRSSVSRSSSRSRSSSVTRSRSSSGSSKSRGSSSRSRSGGGSSGSDRSRDN